MFLHFKNIVTDTLKKMLAKSLKNTCEGAHFTKVADPKTAIFVKSYPFAGIFQQFCLIAGKPSG